MLPEAFMKCAGQCRASENTATQTALQAVCSPLGKTKPGAPFSGSPGLALQGLRGGKSLSGNVTAVLAILS